MAPRGRELIYAEIRSAHTGIVRAPGRHRPADSVYFEGVQITVHAVTPDGRTGLAVVLPITGPGDIVTVPLSGGGKPKPLAATPYDEGYPALRPTAAGWRTYPTRRIAPTSTSGRSMGQPASCWSPRAAAASRSGLAMDASCSTGASARVSRS